MPPPVDLTWRQVRRWRIRRQLLLSPASSPVDVARTPGGIHAQVTSCSALIAGIRCAGTPDLSRGLIRTWAARGTLHLLPADELDLWVGALTARDARRRGPSGADGAVTFVSPAAWLGRPLAPVPAAEAERAVLLRFLAANGPATAADGARWWGEQPAPAKRTVRATGDAVVPVTVDRVGLPGRRRRRRRAGCDTRRRDRPGRRAAALARLRPVGDRPLSHRTHAVPEGRMPAVSRTAGWISPVLVVDGRVAGVWEHTGPAITVRPFAPLPAPTRAAVERTAARYRPLLGADPVAVTWA